MVEGCFQIARNSTKPKKIQKKTMCPMYLKQPIEVRLVYGLQLQSVSSPKGGFKEPRIHSKVSLSGEMDPYDDFRTSPIL